jgi:hypothetical protein
MFFGIAIAVMLFLFVARIALIAFVFAAIMTVIYAAFKGLKNMMGSERGPGYYTRQFDRAGMSPTRNNAVEPLFYGYQPGYRPKSDSETRYVETF